MPRITSITSILPVLGLVGEESWAARVMKLGAIHKTTPWYGSSSLPTLITASWSVVTNVSPRVRFGLSSATRVLASFSSS